MHHLALEPMAGLASAELGRGDLAAAVVQVELILARLAQGVSLEGTEEPMRLQLICYQVLAAAADPRAPSLLEIAYRTLVTRAEAIGDPARRRNYMQAVPYHREIVASWTSRPADAGAA